jgi:hypothetical protein
MTITIDPYLVFIDSIRSEFTRRLYKSLLGKFFASIPSLKGATIQEQCLSLSRMLAKTVIGLYSR